MDTTLHKGRSEDSGSKRNITDIHVRIVRVRLWALGNVILMSVSPKGDRLCYYVGDCWDYGDLDSGLKIVTQSLFNVISFTRSSLILIMSKFFFNLHVVIAFILN